MARPTPRHVHFIAIGGTGVGSLAGLLKARGCEVSGSDRTLYPPMSTFLERWGIRVAEGFDPSHVLARRPDLVVIGNAVRPDNPEARAAIEAGLPYLSFSDALYGLAIEGRHPVVISGTHGKTTTTSLVAYLLHATGRDPGFLVGGISLDFEASFREGSGEHFVVEGDEYDTAFFDKTPKFLHYHPRTLVITSVEFDHADIYTDLEHVKSAFRALVAGMPPDGTIVAALEHGGVREVVRAAPCRVLGYGAPAPEDSRTVLDYAARGVASDAEGSTFELRAPGRTPLAVRSPLHGRFNAENACAALAVLDVLGVPLEQGIAALPAFRGVKRRQEVRGEVNGVLVLDDFAHHPTAVRGTVEAVKARYPDRRLLAVFEPRTNTSRRRIFQDDYARAFDAAELAIVRVVAAEPIYSATGEVSELFSADELVRGLEGRGVPARAFEDVDAIVRHLVDVCRPGDVVLVMSNGAFDGIFEKLLDGLARGAR